MAAAELVSGGVMPEAEVVFAGPAFGEVKDALLRRVSAFVLPSFSEGLPMSVLEAWAYRLPVVMTEHCNLPEGFAAGAAVKTGTGVEEIAAGFGEVFGWGGESLSLMGERGRALVERSFTWGACAAQMAEVYRWVLGAGGKPSCVTN
jgi:poly(glycerol-phosphate) alpha-glucosyltransferase